MADAISLDEDEKDSDAGCEAGLHSKPMDLSLFDPMQEGSNQSSNPTDDFSNIWLMSALSDLGIGDDPSQDAINEGIGSQETLDKMGHSGNKLEANGNEGGTVLKSLADPETDTHSMDPENLSILNLPEPPTNDIGSPVYSPSKAVDEFDPLKPQKKVSCGHGDAGFSITGHIDSASSVAPTDESTSASGQNKPTLAKQHVLHPSSSPSQSPQRKYLPVELGEKGKYILVAARQISLAQQCEASGNFHMAFTYYKNCVGNLLTGVQGDDNAARREVVRRKTARYLMRAEEIYKKHLVDQGSLDDNRWDTGQSEGQEVIKGMDPMVAPLQGPITELTNFRVLGVIDTVMLTMDQSSNNTFVVKVLHKSSVRKPVPNIVPCHCPYMVKLHKFYETDYAIYLLLQHATGGKLWSYVSGFLHQQENILSDVFYDDGEGGISNKNIYTGQCLRQNSLYERNDTDKTKTMTKQESSVENGTGDCDTIKSNLAVGAIKSLETKDESIYSSEMERGEGEGSSEPDKYDSHLLDDIEDAKPSRKFTLGLDEDHDFLSEASSKLQRKISGESNEGSLTKKDAVGTEENFKEILRVSSKPSLENFSINSFDSDSAPCSRFDSTASDPNIESIPEVSENSPIHTDRPIVGPSPSTEDVFLVSEEIKPSPPVHKQLRRLISDETLPKLEPQNLAKIRNISNTSESKDTFDFHKDVIDSETSTKLDEFDKIDKNVPIEHDPILGLDVATKGPDASSFTGSFDEPSIYDIHRHTDADSGSINFSIDIDPEEASNKTKPKNFLEKLDLTSPTEVQDLGNTTKSSESHLGEKQKYLSHKSSTSNSNISKDKTKGSQETVSKRKSPEKRLSNSLSPEKSRPKNRTRSLSGKRSLETDTRRSRKRTLSGVFGELDLADEGQKETVHLPEGCVRQWAAEIITALACLHQMGILCRDLQPSNILLGERGHILLTYFSRWNCIQDEVDASAIANLYSAPEVSSTFDVTPACDWWSLGGIMFELLTGKSLLACYPGGITPHTNLVIPDHISPEGQSLIQELLRYNPTERLGSGINGADEVRHHPFFSGVNWSSLQG